MTLLLLALLTPAPQDRATLTRESLTGSWAMSWGRAEYAVELRPDGSYEAHGGSTVWTGFWSLEEGRLVILERTCDTSPFARYELELSTRDLSGRETRIDIPVKLSRR